MRRFGIIGAGRFGTALAEKLAANGAEVILIDSSAEKIQAFANSPIQAVLGDACSLPLLEEAGIRGCETAVIAIGDNLEGSVMATISCKELGVKNVVAKAKSEIHGKVLERVGADYIIYAERDRAMRLADSLLSRRSVELYEIADGYSIAEVDAPGAMVGMSLAASGVRQRYGVTVLAIRRLQNEVRAPRKTIIASGDDVVEQGDILIVFGADTALAELRGQ